MLEEVPIFVFGSKVGKLGDVGSSGFGQVRESFTAEEVPRSPVTLAPFPTLSRRRHLELLKCSPPRAPPSQSSPIYSNGEVFEVAFVQDNLHVVEVKYVVCIYEMTHQKQSRQSQCISIAYRKEKLP
jgi:hypothetical protein